MLDRLREYRKSGAERQREMLNAYVDGELSPRERVRFEARLAQDPALREEVMALRQLRTAVRMLPRARAPRNFTIDPVVHGTPVSAAAYQLYPFARAATALTAFFFILAVALSVVQSVPFTAQEARVAEAPAEEAAQVADAEVTTVVTEAVTAEEEPAAEEPQALMMAATEEIEAEEAVEEEAAGEAADTASEAAAPETREEPAAEADMEALVPMAPVVTPTQEAATPTPPPLATPAVAAELPEESVGAEVAPSTAQSFEEQMPNEGEAPAVADTVDDQTVEEPGIFDEVTTVQLLAVAFGALLVVLSLFTLGLRRRIR